MVAVMWCVVHASGVPNTAQSVAAAARAVAAVRLKMGPLWDHFSSPVQLLQCTVYGQRLLFAGGGLAGRC